MLFDCLICFYSNMGDLGKVAQICAIQQSLTNKPADPYHMMMNVHMNVWIIWLISLSNQGRQGGFYNCQLTCCVLLDNQTYIMYLHCCKTCYRLYCALHGFHRNSAVLFKLSTLSFITHYAVCKWGWKRSRVLPVSKVLCFLLLYLVSSCGWINSKPSSIKWTQLSTHFPQSKHFYHARSSPW